jgi:putative ABC transport system substrate-binding protein
LAEAETPVRAPFLEGLEQAGFVVGRNVAIEYRFADGPARSPAVPRCRAGGAAAAKRATATIPIVFGTGMDPVQAGLVTTLSRPAGNATGTHVLLDVLIAKRLELLREVLPQPGLVAALFGPTTLSTQNQIRDVETARDNGRTSRAWSFGRRVRLFSK